MKIKLNTCMVKTELFCEEQRFCDLCEINIKFESENLEYKGFKGTMSFDNGVYHGYVLGIKDLTTYESGTIDNLPDAFRKSIDTYLELKRG